MITMPCSVRGYLIGEILSCARLQRDVQKFPRIGKLLQRAADLQLFDSSGAPYLQGVKSSATWNLRCSRCILLFSVPQVVVAANLRKAVSMDDRAVGLRRAL